MTPQQHHALKKCRALSDQRKKLQSELVRQFNVAFPVGSQVEFKKWGADIIATVTAHSDWTEKVRVVSHTGKEYWVDLFWIIGY